MATNKKTYPFTRTDIADFYGCKVRSFTQNVIQSGLHEALPKMLQKKAKIFHNDKPIIEAHFGPCKNWTEYIGDTK